MSTVVNLLGRIRTCISDGGSMQIVEYDMSITKNEKDECKRSLHTFQFGLGSLFLHITLFCLVLSFTRVWLRYELFSSIPYGGPDALDADYVIAGRARLINLFTWSFSAFFFFGAAGLTYAIRWRKNAAKAAYGVSLSWPLWYALPIPQCFTVTVIGSAATVICVVVFFIRHKSRLRLGMSLLFNCLWLGHIYWYFFEWWQVFGD